MRLDSLKAHNFLTFKDFEYFFKSSPLLVQGENLTDDGQSTNGTGKSGLQTIIEQCMTATNSRGVKDSELVRYGESVGNIQLFASCDFRKERLHIDYDIHVKGSNKLRLLIQSYGDENWKEVSFSNMAHGKKFISEWFAIDTDDLFNYYIINNTRFKSFFKSSNTEKVALIERFSDASIVDGIEKIDTETLDKDLKSQGDKVSEIKGKIEQTKELLEKEETRNLNEEKQEAEEEIEAHILQIKEEIGELEKKIPIIKSEEEGFKKTIQEKTDLKAVYETEKSDIDKRSKIAKESLETAKNELKTAREQVESFVKTDWKVKRQKHDLDLEEKKKAKQEAVLKEEQANGQKNQVTQILQNVENALKSSITCPSCSHEFIIDGDIEKVKERKEGALKLKPVIEKIVTDAQHLIKNIKDDVDVIEKLISGINEQERQENQSYNSLNTALNNVTVQVNGFERTVNGFDKEYTELSGKENARVLSIQESNNKISNITVRVGAVETEIKGCEREIEALETAKKNLKVNDNSEQIKELKEILKESEIDLSDWEIEHNLTSDKLFELNQWSKNFKNFRLFLANKSLEVIEYHCNRYLNEMQSDMTVKINGFKVLTDGSVKEEISVSIIRELERSFASFSGGERGRLLFASILANRFMINETHPYGGLDFLAVDEVFEGVDSTGIVSLIDSAKLLSIPVLIITHVSVDETENTITMVKENNVSRIK